MAKSYSISKVRGKPAGIAAVPVLGFFSLLAIVVTFPLVIKLDVFTFILKDSMLQGWTLKWDVHSFLSGPAGLRQIWDANIFYPYPVSLAFSEHLLATAALLMPFILLSQSPLIPANLGVLITTALSGWSMYLLVTWLTKNRWAGLIAGIFFAISPFRLGHITQLHLLSTQWMPLIFLAVARLIKCNRNSDLILLVIFLNLQFLSVINYALLIAMAVAAWTLLYLAMFWRSISTSLLIRFLILGGVTFLLNWPVFRVYQEMSNQMGIVRTLGDAKVYGASFTSYILPVANSLLYGRLLHLPTQLDHLFPGIGVFISTFPGIVVPALALVTVVLIFKPQRQRQLTLIVLGLWIIVGLSFALSFGANDAAFGESWSPVVARLLPYPYLYHSLPFFQGLRVPLRFALLVMFGLSILAGLGFTGLRGWLGDKRMGLAALLLSGLMVMEHFPAPLPSDEPIPHGGTVYESLVNLPPDAVILELPYALHLPPLKFLWNFSGNIIPPSIGGNW